MRAVMSLTVKWNHTHGFSVPSSRVGIHENRKPEENPE